MPTNKNVCAQRNSQNNRSAVSIGEHCCSGRKLEGSNQVSPHANERAQMRMPRTVGTIYTMFTAKGSVLKSLAAYRFRMLSGLVRPAATELGELPPKIPCDDD